MNELQFSALIVLTEIVFAGIVLAIYVLAIGRKRQAKHVPQSVNRGALIQLLERSEGQRLERYAAVAADHHHLDEARARGLATRVLQFERDFILALRRYDAEPDMGHIGSLEQALGDMVSRTLKQVPMVPAPVKIDDMSAQRIMQLASQNVALNEENERLIDDIAELKSELDRLVYEYAGDHIMASRRN